MIEHERRADGRPRGSPGGDPKRSGGSPSRGARPDPEVPERARRRQFSAAYKERILREVDRCRRPGEIGALLRREGLCSSHLAAWREQREERGASVLAGKKRGPAAKPKPSARELQLERENGKLAKKLAKAELVIEFQKKVHALLGIPLKPHDLEHGIAPGQVTGHSDRGQPMISKSLALLFADLGVAQSFSRLHVSDDNPFSEANFKTLKSRPEYPGRLACRQQAHTFCVRFFDWYHHEHRHSALGWMTPADVHYGRAHGPHAERSVTLAHAYHRHPERFVRGTPTPPAVPEAVWINPPAPAMADAQ